MARYALVIGIAEYVSPSLPRLSKTINDAEAIAQLLEQYGDFQSVQRLPQRWNKDKNGYEMAASKVTGAQLGQGLRTFLLEQAANNEALIYFSGHGFITSDGLGQKKGYLATSDSQIEVAANQIVEQKSSISLDSLNQLIRDSQLSSLVVLLDCCHSGYFLERQLVQQTLTAFSSQRDYCLITACRGFERAGVIKSEEYSIFTGAVLKGLAPVNAGNNRRISSDRLFDFVSDELRGSVQEPIRMGWGRSITLVTYPRASEAPVSTPQSDQPTINNSFNMSDNSIENFAGSGSINYKETSNQIRSISINSSSLPSPSLNQLTNQQRCQSLRNHLSESLELLEEYEQQERLTSDPKLRRSAKNEQERLRQEIASYEQEINNLGC
ncbi:MAG: caspase family protein [Nostoc sp.]|uniref:caspase family protein n=1 Tax=Nostoc sp. TaxID=1180 RepID=UPI002FF7622C